MKTFSFNNIGCRTGVKQLLFVMLMVCCFCGFSPLYAEEDLDQTLKQIKILIEIIDEIQKNYVDSDQVQSEELINNAITGMVSSLDDYSVFFNQAEAKEFNEQTQGTFNGLGIQIDIIDGWLTVIEPLPDTPAAKAGLLGGDRVVEIDGVSAKDITIEEAKKRLKGEPGTPVVLKIARRDEKEFIEKTITREEIHTYSITENENRMLDQTTGYIRLRDFSVNAADELETAIRGLQRQGMKALVLDLRDNVGGLMDAAVEICDLFIEKNAVLVSFKDKKGVETAYHSEREPLGNFLLAVLVNEFSASASEIVAGCIQDHHRGVIVGPVGHKTFGKGAMQTMIELDSLPGAAIKITTARYYLPSGRSVELEKGLTPDLFAMVTDEERFNIRREGKFGFIPPDFIVNKAGVSSATTTISPASVRDVFDNGESGEAPLYDVELFTAYQCLKGMEAVHFGGSPTYSLVYPRN